MSATGQGGFVDQGRENIGNVGERRRGFVLPALGAAAAVVLLASTFFHFSNRTPAKQVDVPDGPDSKPVREAVVTTGIETASHLPPTGHGTADEEARVAGAIRPAAVPAEDAVKAAVARLKDAKVPIGERRGELEALVKRADQQAVETLQQTRVPILGAILNKIAPRGRGRYYY